MYRFINQWLGCLDPETANALWQCAFDWIANGGLYVGVDAILENLEPDCYGCFLPFTEAFMTVYGFYYTTIVIDEVPYPCFQPTNLIVWAASVPYILSFNFDLSDAPCTQIKYP